MPTVWTEICEGVWVDRATASIEADLETFCRASRATPTAENLRCARVRIERFVREWYPRHSLRFRAADEPAERGA